VNDRPVESGGLAQVGTWMFEGREAGGGKSRDEGTGGGGVAVERREENQKLRAEVEELRAASGRLSQALQGAERNEQDAVSRLQDALKRLEETDMLCQRRGVQVEELELKNQELAATVRKLKGLLVQLVRVEG
jgi:chromosome segregation ATPase